MGYVPWWEKDKPIALSFVKSKSKSFDRPEKIIKNLLDNTIINSKTGCYEYQKRLKPKEGYGRRVIDDFDWRVHRLSNVLFKGQIPSVPDTSERRAELWVLHRCHNPSCWNPSHLQAGLPSENTEQMLEAKRSGNKYGKYFGKSKYSRLGAETVTTLGEIAEELDKGVHHHNKAFLSFLESTVPQLTEEEIDRLEYNRALLRAMKEDKDMKYYEEYAKRIHYQ
jgi:Zinc-binding loop region of homing endonuclease